MSTTIAVALYLPSVAPRWNPSSSDEMSRSTSGFASPVLLSAPSIWPEGAIVHDQTVHTYLARIRRKLREAGAPEAVETVRGVGYALR